MSKLHALDAELDRLTARAIETDKAIIDMLTANNAALRHENAELRELVREIYEDQCCDGDQWKYRDMLRELGIEVKV